jgi:hypothetical protein
MSTYWDFKFKKENILNYRNILGKEELRKVDDSDRISDNQKGLFCVGNGSGNGAWIYLDKDGDGIITRYAGTSPDNLSHGFNLLYNELRAKKIRCEYD